MMVMMLTSRKIRKKYVLVLIFSKEQRIAEAEPCGHSEQSFYIHLANTMIYSEFFCT
jgi:hypothetical protein